MKAFWYSKALIYLWEQFWITIKFYDTIRRFHLAFSPRSTNLSFDSLYFDRFRNGTFNNKCKIHLQKEEIWSLRFTILSMEVYTSFFYVKILWRGRFSRIKPAITQYTIFLCHSFDTYFLGWTLIKSNFGTSWLPQKVCIFWFWRIFLFEQILIK